MIGLLISLAFIYIVCLMPTAFICAALIYMFKGSGFWKYFFQINGVFILLMAFFLLVAGSM